MKLKKMRMVMPKKQIKRKRGKESQKRIKRREIKLLRLVHQKWSTDQRQLQQMLQRKAKQKLKIQILKNKILSLFLLKIRSLPTPMKNLKRLKSKQMPPKKDKSSKRKKR